MAVFNSDVQTAFKETPPAYRLQKRLIACVLGSLLAHGALLAAVRPPSAQLAGAPTVFRLNLAVGSNTAPLAPKVVAVPQASPSVPTHVDAMRPARPTNDRVHAPAKTEPLPQPPVSVARAAPELTVPRGETAFEQTSRESAPTEAADEPATSKPPPRPPVSVARAKPELTEPRSKTESGQTPSESVLTEAADEPVVRPEPSRLSVSNPAPAESAPRAEPLIVTEPNFREPPVPPSYPRRALRLGQEGTVLLQALVGSDGATRHVEVLESSGFPLLDGAAVKAVRRWHFLPGSRGGQTVATAVQVPVRFTLR